MAMAKRVLLMKNSEIIGSYQDLSATSLLQAYKAARFDAYVLQLRVKTRESTGITAPNKDGCQCPAITGKKV
ncbi:hypothetical protein E2562_017243 [Oryza meyeriana var. granulata]|uniref:Uncharacterized protein n=1 Tax=Oryza meyeriana var. granulata TaxID=110450 RepID=A0A6G1ELV5_9ORYZ|nr:hypothetical protein E2562_017243 [Oryza meyeriana var. granulata]